MHDIRWIRDNAAAFDAALMRRNADFAGTSARLIGLDDARKAAIAGAQEAQTLRNALSKEIGQAMAAKDAARADALKAQVNALKEGTPKLEDDERKAKDTLDKALVELPNLPKDEVPSGADEHGNVEYRRHGEVPTFGFAPKEHFELGEALGGMDFEAAAKLSGSRFVVLSAGIARLSRALGQFMLDMHTLPETDGGHGYTEVNPPILVRDDAMFGTAQLPKFVDDQFTASRTISRAELLRDALHNASPEDQARYRRSEITLTELVDAAIEKAPTREDFWLVPTAEVPLTNLVRESILDEETLPRRYTALTPCFRAEAGSAGRDTRGMLRQHQFEKVELVSITTPETSASEHERMLTSAENILKALGLHYRVMTLCTGDMGFASRKTYDIEVWLPGQNAYREISSCSVCGDFQARRMNARYRAKGAKETQFVHTLNGSGVAVGRALIAVIENYQQADGSIRVPDALRPYMGGLTVIGAKG
ncbi:MAG: serine--tRNA ligase [Bosea sp. (in: a-proteobacteria)]